MNYTFSVGVGGFPDSKDAFDVGSYAGGQKCSY